MPARINNLVRSTIRPASANTTTGVRNVCHSAGRLNNTSLPSILTSGSRFVWLITAATLGYKAIVSVDWHKTCKKEDTVVPSVLLKILMTKRCFGGIVQLFSPLARFVFERDGMDRAHAAFQLHYLSSSNHHVE